jgi:hypothetical protein
MCFFLSCLLVNVVLTVKRICSLQPLAQAGSSLADFSILKMEAILSSETSVHTISTRRHIPEDGILPVHYYFKISVVCYCNCLSQETEVFTVYNRHILNVITPPILREGQTPIRVGYRHPNHLPPFRARDKGASRIPDSSSSILSRLRTRRPENQGSIPEGWGNFCFRLRVQSGCTVHPTSYPICTGGSFPRR